jgi:5-methylcytosine-specific restriction enzyme A
MPQRVPAFKAPRLRHREARPNAAARGYCSKAHRSWRQHVLTRDAWACVVCGHVDNANHADHIVPVSERPDLRYELSNGQCLCQACHMRKTFDEARGET